jgi:DNA invertase Pin-like site-specific DNA recombinase
LDSSRKEVDMAERRAIGPRAALYARVSTTGNGQDVGLQLDELRQVAAQRAWSAVEFIDDGVSGSKDRRPALDRLMTEARAGRLDIVAVWRFDRFARDTRHLLTAMEEFKAMGVHFVSLREQVDTSTPMGKAMFTIISAISELERDLIRERVVAGVRRAQAAGKHCGRPRKEAADKALEAARALLDQGWGWRAVAEATGVQKDTLRRRLKEAGMLAQNPTPQEAA